MRRTKKINFIIAALLVIVTIWALIAQPWRVDKVTIVTHKDRFTVAGRLRFKGGTYIVRVPAHTVPQKHKQDDSTTVILDKHIPTQRLNFPASSVQFIVVE